MATRKSAGGARKPRTQSPTRGSPNAAPARKQGIGLVPLGTRAPEFTLHSTPDQSVSLSDFRGRPVILAFYPADWSPVCGDQLALYNEILPEFHRYGAELMGISVDGVWCHAAFARARHFHFPLLADFHPKGGVAASYGAYSANEGLSNRALFVIDGEGIVRWNYLSPMGVNPGADGILAALESITPSDTAGAERRPSSAVAAGRGETVSARRPPSAAGSQGAGHQRHTETGREVR